MGDCCWQKKTFNMISKKAAGIYNGEWQCQHLRFFLLFVSPQWGRMFMNRIIRSYYHPGNYQTNLAMYPTFLGCSSSSVSWIWTRPVYWNWPLKFFLHVMHGSMAHLKICLFHEETKNSFLLLLPVSDFSQDQGSTCFFPVNAQKEKRVGSVTE